MTADRVRPFKDCDLVGFVPQSAQSDVSDLVKNPSYAAGLRSAGPAWSYVVDGLVVACGGVIPANHKALVWLLLREGSHAYLVGIYRAVKKQISALRHDRLELIVDEGFIQGERMAKMLGFLCETPGGMQCFYPSGRAAYLFARTR